MAIVSKPNLTLDEFMAALDESDRAIESLPIASDMQEEITAIMYAGIQENYDRSATADGIPWAPHAPSTIAQYGPHPLLILSGAMQAASTTTGVAGNFINVTDRSISIGVTLPYAAAQQFGTDKIPARPFFDIPEEYVKDIEDLAANYYINELIG